MSISLSSYVSIPSVYVQICISKTYSISLSSYVSILSVDVHIYTSICKTYINVYLSIFLDIYPGVNVQGNLQKVFGRCRLSCLLH